MGSLSALLFSIFLLIGIGFFTSIVLVMVLLLGEIHYIPLILNLAIIIYLLFLALMFHFFKTNKRKKVFATVSVMAILLASISPLYHAYIENIPTVGTEVDIYKYRPFSEDSYVATLNEEATLKLTNKLPKIDGATALYPLYSAVVQATYPNKEYYPYDSEVMINKTPNAYENLMNGTVDMIFVLEPSQARLQRAKELGVELNLTPIGKEAFVFFVNRKNVVNNLSSQQVKDIYSGKITNWKEVGGKSDSIRAFQRPEDSGSQTALQSFMGTTPIMKAPTEDVAEGMGGIINEVSKYRNFNNAIGYSFRFYSQEMVGNDQIKLLEIDGIAPTSETIRSGEYPLTEEFYIITAGTDNPNVDQLINWVLSPQGQQLVEKVGYIPLNE